MKKSLNKKKKLILENTEKINELLTLDLIKKVKKLHKKVDKLLKKSQKKKYVILREKNKSKYNQYDEYNDEYDDEYNESKNKYNQSTNISNQEYNYEENQSYSPYINRSNNKYNISPSISPRYSNNNLSSSYPTPKRLSFSPNNLKSTVKKLSSPITPTPRTKFFQQYGSLSSRFTKANTMTPQIYKPTPNRANAADALMMLGQKNMNQSSHKYNLRSRTKTNYSTTKSPIK